MQGAKSMQKLIDKLCDHLSPDRIKLFIESGFDQWETVTFMKGNQLVQIGFTPEQCIIAMVAINSQAKQIDHQEIFTQDVMQQVLALAKQHQATRKEKIEQEQMQEEMKKVHIQEPVQYEENQKEFQGKAISEAILLKGVTLRGKEKVPLAKITLMSLEQKELTKICQMQRVPQLQNLHLNKNHIYKIQNLSHLSKLKVLKIQSNQIVKIEGLEGLSNLEQLYLAQNHISKLEGLVNNRKLHFININNQKSKNQMKFDQQTCQALAYCLEVLHCDSNRVRNISNLGLLKVLNTLHLKSNTLGDMQQLSDPFGGMQRLKKMDFRNNPLCSLPKYRDYIVILCKSLQQLDNKKILPTQRQYLVKLYSLKHAKQMRDQNKQIKAPKQKNKQLNVMKLQEGVGVYSHGTDLRGNVVYANTKIHKH